MGGVEVVGEGQVFGGKVIRMHIHRGRILGAARGPGALVEDDDGVLRIPSCASQADMRAGDLDRLTIRSRGDGNHGAARRRAIDRPLDRVLSRDSHLRRGSRRRPQQCPPEPYSARHQNPIIARLTWGPWDRPSSFVAGRAWHTAKDDSLPYFTLA